MVMATIHRVSPMASTKVGPRVSQFGSARMYSVAPVLNGFIG